MAFVLSSPALSIKQDVLYNPITKNNNCLRVYQLRLIQLCFRHAFCHVRQSQRLAVCFYLSLACQMILFSQTSQTPTNQDKKRSLRSSYVMPLFGPFIFRRLTSHP